MRSKMTTRGRRSWPENRGEHIEEDAESALETQSRHLLNLGFRLMGASNWVEEEDDKRRRTERGEAKR